MACFRTLLPLCLALFLTVDRTLSAPTSAVDPTLSLTGAEELSNDPETKDAILHQSSNGLAYAIGAEFSWQSLSPAVRDFVNTTYRLNAERSIYVVPGAYDNAEVVLKFLDIPYVELSDELLAAGKFANDPVGKTLIINSGATINGASARKALKRFVVRGGVMVTTNQAGAELSKIFPDKGLTSRALTNFKHVSPYSVALAVHTTDRVEKVFRESETSKRNCLGSIPYLQKPAKYVHDRLIGGRSFSPLWNLEEPVISISASSNSNAKRRHAHIVNVMESHDLTQPHNGVVSCFERRQGYVYHVVGRLFQLLEVNELEQRVDRTPFPKENAMDLLNATFAKLEPSSRQFNEQVLDRKPPSTQSVISATLSTGTVLRLLAREWTRAAP